MGQLTAEQRATIAYLHKTGKSVAHIQREVGCARATVSRWVKASEEGRGPVRKRRNVRTLIFDHATAVRAAQLLKSQEEGGSKYVARQLFKEGRVVRVPSRQTVTRAAKKASKETGDPVGYVRGRPKKGLTQANKNARVAFCRANLKRSWRNVMFTDRCRFHFTFPGTKVMPGRWVSRSEKDEVGVFKPNRPQCYNVYGGITRYGATKLIPVTGTSGMRSVCRNQKGLPARNITCEEYRSVVSEGLLPGGEGIFSSVGKRSWVLQQDKDPTHGAATAMVDKHNRLRITCVEILPDWPGNSPDLSPIENVWAIVGAKVDKLGCKTFAQFKKAVNRTFQNLPKATLVNLLDSVPKRMRLCLEKDGGRIRY